MAATPHVIALISRVVTQRLAGRDQYAVKLESLIPAGQGDLELLTWEWLEHLGGCPGLTVYVDGKSAADVVGLLDDSCHCRHMGSGHDHYEPVLRWRGSRGED
jgi:hypothetical protein